MDVNGATNMTYLPVKEGYDKANPNSSTHLNWNNVHKEYNAHVEHEVQKLVERCEKGNMSQSQIQDEIRKLQRQLKKDLKAGRLKCH